jgi:hypothetical protein
MAQFLLSVCFDDAYESGFDLSDPDVVRTKAQVEALNAEMSERNIWVFIGGLHSAETAVVVRSKRGELSMTDGPYAETKEQMAGLWVIDVPDRDTALEWAAKATLACERPIEVRAFQE